jgi:hypothetical protein
VLDLETIRRRKEEEIEKEKIVAEIRRNRMY